MGKWGLIQICSPSNMKHNSRSMYFYSLLQVKPQWSYCNTEAELIPSQDQILVINSSRCDPGLGMFRFFKLKGIEFFQSFHWEERIVWGVKPLSLKRQTCPLHILFYCYIYSNTLPRKLIVFCICYEWGNEGWGCSALAGSKPPGYWQAWNYKHCLSALFHGFCCLPGHPYSLPFYLLWNFGFVMEHVWKREALEYSHLMSHIRQGWNEHICRDCAILHTHEEAH